MTPSRTEIETLRKQYANDPTILPTRNESSFKERVIAERNELRAKLDMLDNFRLAPDASALPLAERARLHAQSHAMIVYLTILEMRLQADFT